MLPASDAVLDSAEGPHVLHKGGLPIKYTVWHKQRMSQDATTLIDRALDKGNDLFRDQSSCFRI